MVVNIAQNIAVVEKKPVGIFSLEMSQEELVDRLLVGQADVDAWRLKTGKLSETDFAKLSEAMGLLADAPIYIDDTPGISVSQIRTKARRLQLEHNVSIIIVDYLQLLWPRVQTDNMVQQITEISRSLKALARELNVPVLALSQLSRAVEARHPPVPKLSDLRDSGSIEQDADVVMFIYRDDRYRPNSDRPNQADIMIQKHRNGPLGQATLYFNQQWTSFTSLAKDGMSGHETNQ